MRGDPDMRRQLAEEKPFALEAAQEERSWSELAPDLPEHEHRCSGYCLDWPQDVYGPDDWWEPPDA